MQSAMVGALLYAGPPPQELPVTAILGLVAMLSEGYFLPEGGMGMIPTTLAQTLRENGGVAHLDAPVEKIIVHEGRVRGVEVRGQGRVEADVVLSTVSGMLTFSSLLELKDAPRGLRRKVAGALLSHIALSLQLGLANRIDTSSYYNTVLPYLVDQASLFKAMGIDPKWLKYSVPTLVEPNLAPDGGSLVEMYSMIRQDLPAERWNLERTEQVADETVAALGQRHDINVVVRRVRGPREFQRELNLYKGAVYGLSPGAGPLALYPHKTHIPGLYLAGQTTSPGFGAGPAAVSGILAAEVMLGC